jgi:hypothetical protein
MSLTVLLVARLLSDQHHVGVAGPFTEHGLGRVHPQVAPSAAGGGFT